MSCFIWCSMRLSSPHLGNEEKEAVCRVMDSQVINMGLETREFEKELYAFFGKDDANVICVNSGSAALHLALQVTGIEHGDEVLVPTFTYIATFQSVSATGATPIPIDIEQKNGFINLSDAKNRITKNTKVILPVLFAGCGVKELDDVYEFAEQYNLRVVVDAAHCFGDNRVIRDTGFTCFSFDSIKNITCADGGCIVTCEKEHAEKLKDLRLLGVIGDTDKRFAGTMSWDPDVTDQGWRYHMNNISAAIGRAQLKKFEKFKKIRCKYARMYQQSLPYCSFPFDEYVVPHKYPIVVNENKRDALRDFLAQNNIPTGVQYKPNHLFTKFNLGYALPNAEQLYKKILLLPLHTMLTEEDVSFVIEKVLEFYKKYDYNAA